MSYQISFHRQGRDLDTIYWAGSVDETRELAKQIASRCGADVFRIVEFTSGDSKGKSARARHFETLRPKTALLPLWFQGRLHAWGTCCLPIRDDANGDIDGGSKIAGFGQG
jgi:hypothetical protein